MTRRLGRPFETLLDGYFPLAESLRQGLDRLGLDTALVLICAAPVLHLPDRPPEAPVPMRLPRGTSGLIRRLLLLARREGRALRLAGAGTWTWEDGSDRPLTPATRLAEPLFLRGLGLTPGTPPEGSRFWGFGRPPRGLERLADFGAANLCLGTRRGTEGLWLAPPDAGAARRLADEFGA